jgi:hypothetical protein
MAIAAATLAKYSPPPPLPAPPVGNHEIFFSEEIWVVFSFGIRRHHSPLIWCFAGLPPLC